MGDETIVLAIDNNSITPSPFRERRTRKAGEGEV